MVALKVSKLGNSLGVTLPKEAAAALNVRAGDVLYLTEAPGGYRVTPYDPTFARQMDVARTVMRRRRNALRELAGW
jgi:putative addiction module antidote